MDLAVLNPGLVVLSLDLVVLSLDLEADLVVLNPDLVVLNLDLGVLNPEVMDGEQPFKECKIRIKEIINISNNHLSNKDGEQQFKDGKIKVRINNKFKDNKDLIIIIHQIKYNFID